MKKIISVLVVLTVLGNINTTNAESVIEKAQRLQKANAQSQRLKRDLEKNPDSDILLHDIGLELYKADKYAEAEPYLIKSLAIRERILGKDHKEVADVLRTLALVYEAQGKYEQAESLFKRSLAIKEKSLSRNNFDYIFISKLFADLYKKQAKYEQAESLLKKCLEIIEKTFDEEHYDFSIDMIKNDLETLRMSDEDIRTREDATHKYLFTVIPLIKEAVELEIQTKLTEAEPLLEKAAAMTETIFDKDSTELSTILGLLGQVYSRQGKYEQAEAVYLRELAINEKLFGTNHLNLAKNLDSLADVYREWGKYNQANEQYLRSLVIREQAFGTEKPETVISINNLATLHRDQGYYKKAEEFLKRGLIIREKSLGQDASATIESLNLLANLYREQGKYEQAEPLLLKVAKIAEKNFNNFQIEIATSKNVSSKNNDEKITKLSELFSTFITSLANIGTLYNIQGKYPQAEFMYQKAKNQTSNSEKLFFSNEKFFNYSNNNMNKGMLAAIDGVLAHNYYDQAKYEQAEYLLLNNIAFFEKTNQLNKGAKHFYLLATIYDEQGKYEKADPLYLRYSAILEKTVGKGHLDYARLQGNLAKHYRLQGQYDKAESLHLQSLAKLEKILDPDHPDIAKGITELARVYTAQGDYNKAVPLLQKSLRLNNQSLNRWLWGTSEETRRSYLQTQEKDRNFYLSFYTANNAPEEAFYFSLTRKSLLLQIASEMNALAKQNPDTEIQKQAEEFKSLQVQIANLAFSNKTEDKNRIQSLEEQRNNLEMQLSQKLASFKRSKTEITPEEVLEKLNPEQIVIDFLVYNEIDFKTDKEKAGQVIALIADKENGIKLIKLGELAPIAEAIKNYRTTIVPTETNKNSREQTLTETAKTLYQQLWQPLTPYLKDKKTVYLIPDGILHLLPFKALQDPSGKYLAENYELITLSSARDIVLPPLEGKPSKSAIFAAPDYGNSPAASNTVEANELQTIHFSPLPNALNEGQQIDKLFKKTKVDSLPPFLKAQATEQAINGLTAPKILHLSTHGFFLSDIQPDTKALEGTRGFMRSLDNPLPMGKIENPLTRSGLAFANANLGVKGIKQNDGTDGILTALEVLNLNLEGTDLVTLSACDTGVGDIKVGEGVYSLNRAFQEAGAKAVLSTLWEVDDQASSEFMQKFYTRFLEGKPAQTAIQETQQEFMQHEKYRNPYYWAGFVMTGKE